MKTSKTINTDLTTGWFGQEGKNNGTQVHIRKSDGVCLCGYKPHKTYKYQWCAYGIQMDYIECPKCKEKAKKILKILKEG